MKKLLVIMLFFVTATMVSGCGVRTVTKTQKMNASAATAQIRSEGMRIWSRPLELGFVVDTEKGDNGKIVDVYPKAGQVVTRQLTGQEAADARMMLAEGGELIPVYGVKDFRFENLDSVQQAAILSIIKENGLDGFYVTMIEETIATTVTSQKQLNGTETFSGNNNYQVIVQGFALKIKEFGEVSEQRSDAERNALAGSKEKETIHYIR